MSGHPWPHSEPGSQEEPLDMSEQLILIGIQLGCQDLHRHGFKAAVAAVGTMTHLQLVSCRWRISYDSSNDHELPLPTPPMTTQDQNTRQYRQRRSQQH